MRVPALWLMTLLRANGEVHTITTDAAFEDNVISSPACWAVMFESPSRDMTEAEKVLQHLDAVLPSVKLGRADVDHVKTFVSEFNVRKRMVPRLLVFNSRARQAEVIKISSDATGALQPASTVAEAVLQTVKGVLADNPHSEGGDCEKLTLAIGGKSEL